MQSNCHQNRSSSNSWKTAGVCLSAGTKMLLCELGARITEVNNPC